MTVWCGSGSGSGFGSGSWIRILLFSSLTFKMPAKNQFFNTIFSAYYFLKVHLHHFSKIKSQKESQNSRNQGFSSYFCMMIEGSGSGSIPLTSGSGSGRPKNMWIRIRICIQIRNTEDICILCSPTCSGSWCPPACWTAWDTARTGNGTRASCAPPPRGSSSAASAPPGQGEVLYYYYHRVPYSTYLAELRIRIHFIWILVADPHSFHLDPDPDPALKAEYRSGSRVLMTKKFKKKKLQFTYP